MRVQHNIMAMNSYRNYNNNTSTINKNIEKLSSGYKINRAGDDAAGLAISEKMRAQISGLEGAQKNAKDGISLVQTAEGALTEVHSMLNRMYTLAEQSANGTYDISTDRAQLQKEVDALRTEINRIADSANFNGIKLLDGSISGKAQAVNLEIKETTAVKGVYETGVFKDTGKLADSNGTLLNVRDIGKTLDYTVTWKDANGNQKNTTVSLTFQGDGSGAVATGTNIGNNYFTDASGKKYNIASSDGKLAATDAQLAFKAGLMMDDEFSSAFNVLDATTATPGLKFEAKADGSEGAVILATGQDETTSLARDSALGGAVLTSEQVRQTTAPLDALQKFNATQIIAVTSAMAMSDVRKNIFEIDGHRFAVGTFSNSQREALDDDVTLIKIASSDGANPTATTDASVIAAEISRITGMATKAYTSNASDGSGITAGDITFVTDRLKLSGSDLQLQIGDTADSWNQMSVKVEDMHTTAMGIEYISITDEKSAAEAMASIKDAINYVSNTRGTLGATQNRLEHTINNLSVMRENIQDAESTIRDTDVADEMMKYTKNSILVQSAQAMLAQANQQPQGVLQLLQ